MKRVALLAAMAIASGCGGGGGDEGSVNQPPIANAGHGVLATSGSRVPLDGSGSRDPDGGVLSYAWTLIEIPLGSTAALSQATTVAPSFVSNVPGQYVVALVVSDGSASSAPAHVTVNVLDATSNLPDTGQVSCYGDRQPIPPSPMSEPCPLPGAELFGQDGQYVTNPPDLSASDAVVQDHVTGLTWQRNASGSLFNQYQASGTFDAAYNPTSVDVCGSLVLGGYDDWRLPTRHELLTIVNYGQWPRADAAMFPGTQPGNYWTSVPAGNRYVVDFGDGQSSAGLAFGGPGTAFYVRCVRGPAWGANAFLDVGNGTIRDTRSGLLWEKAGDGVARNWSEALGHCEGLSLAGENDWRLPNIKELESLVDPSRSLPCIDVTSFPNTTVDHYWTSTTLVSSPNYAFTVDFSFGRVEGYASKTGSFNFVRCVH